MKNLLSIAKSALGNPAQRKRRQAAGNTPSEALEDRMLLSNVTISFQNGDLRIEGDSNDNALHVRQTAGGIVAEGLQGTTINGNANTVFVGANVSDDVIVDFRRGGNNAILLEDMQIGDDVQVRGGSGRDHLVMGSNNVGDDVNIKTGNGADIVYLENNNVEDTINVNTGKGRDLAAVGGDNVEADTLKINTGAGRDTVLVGGMRVRNLTDIKTGSGEDGVFIGEFRTEDLKVNLGQNDDHLFIFDSQIDDATQIKAGSGFDRAEEDSTNFANPASLSSIESFDVVNEDVLLLDAIFGMIDDLDDNLPVPL